MWASWFADRALWSPYASSAGVIGGFATGIGVLVGGFSLLLLWLQTRATARASGEATAFDAQKEYMLLCLKYPEFASSYSMSKHLKIRDFTRILTDSTFESEKALWFFSYVLFAMNQLLIQTSSWGRVDPSWLATVEAQLAYHHSLLAQVWPVWKDMYAPVMDRVVQDVSAGRGRLPGLDMGQPYQPPPRIRRKR